MCSRAIYQGHKWSMELLDGTWQQAGPSVVYQHREWAKTTDSLSMVKVDLSLLALGISAMGKKSTEGVKNRSMSYLKVFWVEVGVYISTPTPTSLENLYWLRNWNKIFGTASYLNRNSLRLCADCPQTFS
jgi:hypothetical protein